MIKNTVICCAMLLYTFAMLNNNLNAQENRLTGSTQILGDVSQIHDPSIIKENGVYYVFSSNHFKDKLLPIFCSKDLKSWTFCGNVFDKIPEWAKRAVPGAKSILAPNIKFYNNKYYLYYSVSTFGSKQSVIGLVTNDTLDPSSPKYNWIDQGLVIASTNHDNWNAIDPNFVVDKEGSPWLAFGSFGSGIKLVALDHATGKLINDEKHSLAARPDVTPSAIEAPFIVYRNGYYYLFVSFDMCCKTKNSTYKIMVGRSGDIAGPYFDKKGRNMIAGGGTLVLDSVDAWKGPGGQSILLDIYNDSMVFHAYNATDGKPTLQILPISWIDSWPVAASWGAK